MFDQKQNETIRNLLTEYELIEKALDEKICKKKETEIKKQQHFIQKNEGILIIIKLVFTQ